VLTEILLAVLRKSIAQCNDSIEPSQPIEVRYDLQLEDLSAFRDFQAAVYDIEIPNRIGYNSAGQAFVSPDTKAIDHEAQARAENIVEYVRAYALFAVYIGVATVFGVPIVSTLALTFGNVGGVHTLALVLDALLFLFAFWLIHLCYRYWQGRPLFERIGGRAEVYIDRRYIARMIERYNATLFSNAPAFLTPYFYSADTVQDALHRFGIRAHRGVVTIHRIADERMGLDEANNAAEANMVLAQIGGIRFNRGQPQSRDKVRQGSRYVANTPGDRTARPYQTLLTDHLADLRARYNGKLSPAVLRLVSRRLLDLCDGLIAEYVIGYRRKSIVNRAIWDVVAWLPGAELLAQAVQRFGFDLKNATGDADTGNQAQIQSTKHPVSPLDAEIDTMQARLSFSLLDQDQDEAEPFAILNFLDDGLLVKLNGHALKTLRDPSLGEMLLVPDGAGAQAMLQGVALDGSNLPVSAQRESLGSRDCLVIRPRDHRFHVAVPLDELSDEQLRFLQNMMYGDAAEPLADVA
jgi:hypothetical protein